MKSASAHAMLEPGTICRSKDPIIRVDDEEKGRLCRVLGVVPEARWRTPGLPEYKVELVALPVTAFRRQGELSPLPPSDFDAIISAPAAFDSASA